MVWATRKMRMSAAVVAIVFALLACAVPAPAQIFISKKHPELSVMFAHGRFQPVLLSCAKILATDPNDDEALYFRAAAEFGTDQNRYCDRALLDINKALLLRSNQPAYFYKKAEFLHHAQDDAEALATVETACRLDPTAPESWLLKADILLYLRRYDEAIACGTKSQKLFKQVNPYAEQTIARALIQKSQFEAAIQHVSVSLKVDPDNVFYRTDRIRCAQRLRLWHQVIADCSFIIGNFQTGKMLKPTQAEEYYRMRAQAYVELKEYGKALSDYDVAIKLSPDVRQLHVEAYRLAALLSDKERMQKEKAYIDGYDQDFRPIK